MRNLGRFFAVFLVSIALQMMGAWTNNFAISNNGKQMPVLILGDQTDIVIDYRHTLLTENSKDKWLCDIFPTPFIYADYSVGWKIMSVGDIILHAGEALFLLLPLSPLLLVWGWVRRIYAKKHSTLHHRKSRSLSGTSETCNRSELPQHLQQAWHTLFQAMRPEAIAKLINERYLDPNFEFGVRRKGTEKFYE